MAGARAPRTGRQLSLAAAGSNGGWHNAQFLNGALTVELRRWLPYRRVETLHLGLMLATARVIAWIGMLVIVAGVAYGIAVGVSHQGQDTAILALGTVLGLVGYGLAALAISGVLAALVGIEEHQRQRAERD